MIKTFESADKLVLLHDWLNKISKKNQDKNIHTALAKVLVLLDQSPKFFLDTNANYNRQVLGRFCENNGKPDLAIAAYKKAHKVDCDAQLIDITTQHQWWEAQAKFLVERMEVTLWD